MKEPVLLIMAAGMGSRYGGLKQMDPIGPNRELIIDFSLFDGKKAGFNKAVFIIKEEMKNDFHDIIGANVSKFIDIEYAFQSLADVPDGFSVPEGREKPWGTCHAVLSAKHLIDGPFAVINADDFYGAGAFQQMYDFLKQSKDDDKLNCSMVGYRLGNTLTENGHVARGVCGVRNDGFLAEIVERTNVMHRDGKIMFTEDEGATWAELSEETHVSMNFWGFSKKVMDELSEMLPFYMSEIIKNNPLKGEFFLPLAVESLILKDKARFKVLMSEDKWYGVTYKDDREDVANAFKFMKDQGLYPEVLWQ